MKRRTVRNGMMMATMALFIAACGSNGESVSDTTAPPSTEAAMVVSDQPIRLGSVNSITGPVPFPEASAAAAAYFDRLNANGGIGGRMIEYTVEDDAADPALASAAARKLVDCSGTTHVIPRIGLDRRDNQVDQRIEVSE